MKRIYLDNAATSFPKAPGTADVIKTFLEKDCTNISRTTGQKGMETYERITNLRSGIAELFNLSAPESVILNSGATESLNLIIKGIFNPGDHVLVSSCEHNSLMRPLVQSGISFSRIPCDRQGYILTDRIGELVRPETKAILICAAGNVSGAVQDIGTIAEIAEKHGINLFIDAAQNIVDLNVDMEAMGIAGVVFSGHKDLMGPEGTGGVALRSDIAQTIRPLISGGTGSKSDTEEIPDILPDRLEAGTQNIGGLLALAHSFSCRVENRKQLHEQERRVTELLFRGLESIEGIKIVGAPLDRPRTDVISITSDRMDIADISQLLLERYGIETRVGLHCSPSSHKALGTFPTGTLRFSPGPFTTEEEIRITVDAMKEIING